LGAQLSSLGRGGARRPALTSAGVRLIFTTAHHLEASGDILRAHVASVILLEEPEVGDGLAVGAG
jgi:hypothetical protein